MPTSCPDPRMVKMLSTQGNVIHSHFTTEGKKDREMQKEGIKEKKRGRNERWKIREKKWRRES